VYELFHATCPPIARTTNMKNPKNQRAGMSLMEDLPASVKTEARSAGAPMTRPRSYPAPCLRERRVGK